MVSLREEERGDPCGTIIQESSSKLFVVELLTN